MFIAILLVVFVVCINFSVISVVLHSLILRLFAKQADRESFNKDLECFSSTTFRGWLYGWSDIAKASADIKILWYATRLVYLIFLVAYPGFKVAKLIAGLTVTAKEKK